MCIHVCRSFFKIFFNGSGCLSKVKVTGGRRSRCRENQLIHSKRWRNAEVCRDAWSTNYLKLVQWRRCAEVCGGLREVCGGLRKLRQVCVGMRRYAEVLKQNFVLDVLKMAALCGGMRRCAEMCRGVRRSVGGGVRRCAEVCGAQFG